MKIANNKNNQKKNCSIEFNPATEKEHRSKKTKKKCNKCQIVKDLSEFSKKTANKDGLRSWCRKCSNECTKEWRKTNPDKIRIYEEENTEKIKENGRIYRLKNKEEIRRKRIESYPNRKEKIKEYRAKNKESIAVKQKVRAEKFNNSNPDYNKITIKSTEKKF